LTHPSAALRISVVEGSDATVVMVLGELDCLTAPQVDDLRKRLATGSSTAPRVIVDAQHLQFVDVAGLDALIRLANAVEEFVLQNANSALRRLVSVLNLSQALGLPEH
jgi:anti-anti-sigma factor